MPTHNCSYLARVMTIVEVDPNDRSRLIQIAQLPEPCVNDRAVKRFAEVEHTTVEVWVAIRWESDGYTLCHMVHSRGITQQRLNATAAPTRFSLPTRSRQGRSIAAFGYMPATSASVIAIVAFSLSISDSRRRRRRAEVCDLLNRKREHAYLIGLHIDSNS